MVTQHCQFCFEPNQGNYPCPHCHCSHATSPKLPLSLNPGTVLHGRYEIGKILHQSKFSSIYLAWNTKEQKKCAIKEFLPIALVSRVESSPKVIPHNKNLKKKFHYGLERFLDEALTLSKFQKNANIVSVLSLFKANDTGYIVMDYIEGVSLTRYIKNKGTLSWTQTLGLFSRIMSVMHEIHQQGILHSGICPDKIFLCKNSSVKLLGFSEAKHTLEKYIQVHAETNKPGYAAEEQYIHKDPEGPWTDIYSIAASMYFCLTGQTPPEATLRLNSDTLIKPSLLNVEIPVTAELALLRGLAVPASLRPQTLEQFYNALTRKIQDAKTAAAETINKTPDPVPTREFTASEKPESPGQQTHNFGLSSAEAFPISLKLLSGLLLTSFIIAVIIVVKVSQNPGLNPSVQQSAVPNDPLAEQKKNSEFNHAMILKKQGRDELALPIFINLAKQGYTRAQAILDLMYEEGKKPAPNPDPDPVINEQPKNPKGTDDRSALNQKRIQSEVIKPQSNLNVNTTERELKINDGQTFINYYQAEKQPTDEDNLLSFYNQDRTEEQELAASKKNISISTNPQNSTDPAAALENSGLGIAEAQSFLAGLYFEGKGISQDYNQAVYWYNKAATQGNPIAIASLKKLNLTNSRPTRPN